MHDLKTINKLNERAATLAPQTTASQEKHPKRREPKLVRPGTVYMQGRPVKVG